MNQSNIELVEQVPLGKGTAYLLKNIDLLAVIRAKFGIPNKPIEVGQACWTSAEVASLPAAHESPQVTHRQSLTEGGHTRSRRPRAFLSVPHLVTFHITNAHWFLYLTTIEGRPYCSVINRRDRHHYVVDMFENMSKTLFADTLITGEVFGPYFLVDDLLVLDGVPVLCATLPARLHIAGGILAADSHQNRGPFVYALKTYYTPDIVHDIQRLNASLSAIGVSKFRSFVFTPLVSQGSGPPSSATLRLKPTDMMPNTRRRTINPHRPHVLLLCRVHGFPDVYSVALVHEPGPEDHHAGGGVPPPIDLGLACVPDQATSVVLREAFRDVDRCRFLCSFNRQFRKWQPRGVIT